MWISLSIRPGDKGELGGSNFLNPVFNKMVNIALIRVRPHFESACPAGLE